MNVTSMLAYQGSSHKVLYIDTQQFFSELDHDKILAMAQGYIDDELKLK